MKFLENYSGPFRLIPPKWSSNKKIIEGYFNRDQLKKYNEENDYNIYYFPNYCSKNPYNDEIKYLFAKLIDRFKCCFVDMDLKDLEYDSIDEFLDVVKKFEIEPSMVVESGNGCHVYWFIEDLCAESFIEMQFKLINYFNTDPSIWTILRLLRWPQSLNTKEENNPKPTIIREELSSENTYELSDFKFLPQISDNQEKKKQRHLDRMNGEVTIQLEDDVDLSKLPEKFVNLMDNDEEIATLFKKPELMRLIGKRRSASDFVLGLKLLELGFNNGELMQVLSNTQKAVEMGNSSYPEYTFNSIMQRFESQNLNNSPKELKITKDLQNIIKNVYGEF